MTNRDDETRDVDPDRLREAADTGGMDTTMAAGPRSGAAGGANAELGTSGPPAEDLLSPEVLARTEVTGGAGLDPNAVGEQGLEEYFSGAEEIEGQG